jgi:DNA-binding transcriptional LysR family regulator
MYKSGLMELEAVVAIARLGSFRAAAVDLDVSPTAIGNAVSSLENRLGVRLFNRTTRNVALTSAGREYVEAVAPALSDIRNRPGRRRSQPQADRHATVQLLARRGTPATDALRLRVSSSL